MKIKTNVLNGAALDWAVEEAEGLMHLSGSIIPYSTEWAHGGVIIERERITLDYRADIDSARPWIATLPSGAEEHGATPLIAAMRVYAAGALGDSIDIPEELL
jgi:hypothetical protein